MTIAIVAEKPAVARDIARVLGASRRGQGFLHGNGYAITWALGHLVTLAQPHEIRPEWRRWHRDLLPMLPESWPLVVCDETRDQFEVVRKMLTSAKVERVVCATDAGREGELIFRYIYDAAGCRKPVSRLWISSLTADAIRKGFAALRDGREFDALAAAARGRSQADWLVGMNLSRACTLAFGDALAHGEVLSVGRVQTPTLAMVVERELAIRAFVPEAYLEVLATFTPVVEASAPGEPPPPSYRGTWFRGKKATVDARRLPADGEEAGRIVERATRGQATIESVGSETRRMPPPLFYDLTELQRHANRLFGWSAQKTLGVAQKLYEQHKLISYPRTDSRHLSQDVAATLGEVVEAIAEPYRDRLAPETGVRPLGRRFVDDSRVTDHHAIIPTPTAADQLALGGDERKLYDLICRRLLAAWHDDHVWSVTTVITAITTPSEGDGEPVVDRYHSSGTMVEQVGWKVLDLGEGKKPPRGKGKKAEAEAADEEDQKLPPLTKGQRQRVLDARALAKKTRPPKRFTEATLLTAMETAGRTLDDKELSDAMKESGLGTPATRAEIIETLLRREYLLRKGKTLEATDRGIRLIAVVHPQVKSPAMTGRWEAELKQIQRGKAELASFMEGIEAYVREVVGEVFSSRVPERSTPPPAPGVRPEAAERSVREPLLPLAMPEGAAPGGAARSPTPVDQLSGLLETAFGLTAFRPYQETACRAVTEGLDVLLVMPTGAGKSLCYQLPGLARAGSTLVISPLIALMEDQVAKLREVGLYAERIHSGRDRASSRLVSADYLAGRLDFLFIAPERLSVPGFPEMLARRKPVLIAVDEAHCISHWGHDFRPDYRLIGQRLPLLRPAPVIALTATATPLVQDDIATQLGLESPRRLIHGFRRTNIGVEVVEMLPSQRRDAVGKILSDSARRPAIVYAPTRKEADALGEELDELFPAAAYHAGMAAAARDRVQAAFVTGQIEVIVATIAFGMGIDKPDVRTVIHTGLPGTLEGYYQEIGRAGRDGKPARAILLYSYVDRRTHEFFHGRDYPEPEVLEQIFAALTPDKQSSEGLADRLGIDADTFQKALEKLWIHGGALVDPEENVAVGDGEWKKPYVAQRNHRLFQLEEITRFAQARDCRMLHLVRHFGDQEDSGEPCGGCDVCAPEGCLARSFRAPTPEERETMRRIFAVLREWNDQGTGQLFQRSCGAVGVDRRSFERVLSGLVRAELVETREDSFRKDGRTIHFQRASLTPAGYRADDEALERVQVTVEPKKAKKKTKRAKKKKVAAPRQAAKPKKTAAVREAVEAEAMVERPAAPQVEAPAELVEALKQWRLGVARKKRIPAFRILTDRTIMAIASARPEDEEGLLAVSGVGPASVRKYGEAILEIVAAGDHLL